MTTAEVKTAFAAPLANGMYYALVISDKRLQEGAHLTDLPMHIQRFCPKCRGETGWSQQNYQGDSELEMSWVECPECKGEGTVLFSPKSLEDYSWDLIQDIHMALQKVAPRLLTRDEVAAIIYSRLTTGVNNDKEPKRLWNDNTL